MPELPEVETVVRTLRPQLCGRSIVNVRASRKRLRRPWRPAWSKALAGTRIIAVRRRGKWIVIELDREQVLLAHLGMTGRFYVVDEKAPLAPHTHLIFGLQPGRDELRFHDPRRFGSAALLPAAHVERFLDGERLGPEPFDLRPADFRDRLRRTRRCLKAVLLDQRVVAGVGNIYADESLFEARLAPGRRGCEIGKPEADRLCAAIVTVLRRAIERHGSTIRNYFYGDGQAGEYQNEFRVYQQTGQPCQRCRTPIQQTRLAGRATHFCPRCQRSPVQRSPAARG